MARPIREAVVYKSPCSWRMRPISEGVTGGSLTGRTNRSFTLFKIRNLEKLDQTWADKSRGVLRWTPYSQVLPYPAMPDCASENDPFELSNVPISQKLAQQRSIFPRRRSCRPLVTMPPVCGLQQILALCACSPKVPGDHTRGTSLLREPPNFELGDTERSTALAFRSGCSSGSSRCPLGSEPGPRPTPIAGRRQRSKRSMATLSTPSDQGGPAVPVTLNADAAIFGVEKRSGRGHQARDFLASVGSRAATARSTR